MTVLPQPNADAATALVPTACLANALPIGGSEQNPIVDGHDPNAYLNELGRRCHECLQRTKANFFELALWLSAAKKEFGRIGRGSRFPAWLERHVPDLDSKTVNRLVSVAAAYGLNMDNVSQFTSLATRFRLTALYELSRHNVPAAARDAALAMAKASRMVTLADARELIKAHSLTIYLDADTDARNAAAPPLYEKNIALPAGMVTIAVNHDDFRQALIEALDLIDES